MLHSGDFVWFANGGSTRVYRNGGEKEARFLQIMISPAHEQ
jgi:hypothetical protein